jgi:hypothetical protein
MEIGREMIHCPNVPCLAIEEIFAKFLCIIWMCLWTCCTLITAHWSFVYLEIKPQRFYFSGTYWKEDMNSRTLDWQCDVVNVILIWCKN